MLTVDGKTIDTDERQSLLWACLEAGIYIPHLCYHPAIPTVESGEGCGLCKVVVDGNEMPVNACQMQASSVNDVITENDTIRRLRRNNLAKILATHPHVCLTCNEADGCTRTQCSMNVPLDERCCSLFGNCELQRVADYIGIPEDTPAYKTSGLPRKGNELFYDFDYNLCIACGRCIRICRDLKKVDALTYSEDYGRPVAVPRGKSLNDSGCIFCGACVEVCPTGAMMDKPWTYKTKEQAIVPCRTTCPAEIDVPLYISLIGEKRYGEAVATIREKAPFPGILGRVCYSPCEGGCRRNLWDQPVAIRSLKRFAADHDDGYWKSHLVKKPGSGKKVAVVGGGPAGLTASYYLRILGHEVDLFDMMPLPGGMLRYGIPEYRLPRDILDAEINGILELGVRFSPRVKIKSPCELDGYDAVFWATGAQLPAPLPEELAESAAALDGLALLREINSGNKVSLPGDVMVIGGGNVATDVARCALRLGANHVKIVYRRGREQMPAYDAEVTECLDEGVEFQFFLSPVKIRRSGSKIKVIFQKTKLGLPDGSGRRAAVPVKGAFCELTCDHLFAAIGQRVETAAGLALHQKGTLRVEKDFSTSAKGVFAGGDNVTGAASVVEAIEAGRLAAQNIDKYLGGDGSLPSYGSGGRYESAPGKQVRRALETPPCLEVRRRKGFDEIEQAYNEAVAVRQALRCARCDLRLSIPPVTAPPERYLKFDIETIGLTPEQPGVIQLRDAAGNVALIAGAQNIRQTLLSKFREGFAASRFTFEVHPMYTQRESEILSQYLQRHGKLPVGNDIGEELF